MSGHGLTQDRGNDAWRTSSILRFGIKPQQNGGVFGGAADAQGVPGLTGSVELGALWSALPGQEPPAGVVSWPLAMPVWPHVYMEGQANLARLGAAHRGYVFLRDQVPAGDPKVLIEHLKKYPAAEGARLETPQGILQHGPTPWGYGPSVRWPQPPANVGPEGIPSAEMLESHVTSRVPRYRYGREHWLVPVVGDGNDDMPPLLIWWSLIFGLSLLARYSQSPGRPPSTRISQNWLCRLNVCSMTHWTSRPNCCTRQSLSSQRFSRLASSKKPRHAPGDHEGAARSPVSLENRIRAVDPGFVAASGGSDVLVDEAAQDRFSSDSVGIEVGHGDAGHVV